MRPSLVLLLASLGLTLGCPTPKDTGETTPETDLCPAPEDDLDGDCFAEPEDCDDSDYYVNPDADEVPYDGKDNDCAGDGDLTDWDGDGYDGEMAGGDDCNDGNPDIYPGAEETCQDRYDGVDRDCDGSEPTADCDGDGYDRWEDCNDELAESYPGAEETWYDGVDGDCDMQSDYDQDADGYDHEDYGGDDCDDTRTDVYYGAQELLDGVDHDCNGETDRLDQNDAFIEYLGDNYNDYDYYVGWRSEWSSDYDGDGLMDIVACGPYWGYCSYDKESYEQGLCYVLPGSGPGADDNFAANDLGYMKGGAYEYLGYGMSVVGDLDGDGLDEVVAGAPTYTISGYKGAALLFTGADLVDLATLSTADATATLYGSSYFGCDVSNIDDVDGDGVAEIIVGAYDISGSQEFAVWSGADAIAGGNLHSSSALATFSSSGYGGDTMGAGDFDGDGLAELITGSDGFEWVLDESGEFYVKEGQNGAMYIISGDDLAAGGSFTGSSAVTISGSDSEGLGWRNSWTYDSDGDGYDELLASGFYADGDEDQAGVVYVIDGDDAMDGGSASSLASFTIQGSTENGWGSAATRPADLDGNSLGDLVFVNIGDMVSDIKSANYVFLDSSISAGGSAVASDSSMYFSSKYEDDQYGFAADFADYDGDGDDDVLMSAYYPMEGKVWAFESDL